jgi:hypothetical protein
MPYQMRVENGNYCVYKDGEFEAMQCYQSIEKAVEYLTALNIATSDEIKATYIAPQSVADNARLALDVRSEKPQSQQGMTAVGLARANQLANREPISLETVQRMVAYFDRHEIDKEGATWSERGKGWQAWHGWGGDEGRVWANRILREINMETKASRRHSETDMEALRIAAHHTKQTMKALRTVGYDGIKPKSIKALDESVSLTERQIYMYETYEALVEEYGAFDQGIGANGAHYADGEQNPFIEEGIVCGSCVFFMEGKCEIVQGNIDAEGICKLWIIPESALNLIAVEELDTEETMEESVPEPAEIISESEEIEDEEESISSMHEIDEKDAMKASSLDSNAIMKAEAAKRFAKRLIGVK